MSNETKNIVVVAGLMVGVVAIIWGLWFISQPKESSVNLAPFAQCLATKKVTMYGAYWCSHCQAQKKLFGDTFQYVPYVECTEQTKVCEAKGIQGFPTWLIPDGKGGEKKLEGEQALQTLAQESGCTLPVSEK